MPQEVWKDISKMKYILGGSRFILQGYNRQVFLCTL